MEMAVNHRAILFCWFLCASVTSLAAQESPAVDPDAHAQPEMPQLIYSVWAKFCGKGNDPNDKEVCFTVTGKDARSEAGQPVPNDPKMFGEQQKKLQEDLQKRADELRKKLQSQGAAAPK
jgi:hypothetical protein